MAPSRKEKKKANDAEAIHFAPLDGAGWEDSGYLASDDDQSWREMEALRIGAYDRIGHLPPRDNQSWREEEALRLGAAREADSIDNIDDTGNVDDTRNTDDTGSTDDSGNAEAADGAIADLAAPEPVADPLPDPVADTIAEPVDSMPDSYVPVRETVPEFPSARRGAGGVMLLLVAVVGLVTVALAVPNILTSDFWRAQWAAVAGKPAVPPERAASLPPAAPVVTPPPVQPSPAPVRDPGLNAPPANSELPARAPADEGPTANAMPEATPSPRPNRRGDRATMVIGSDGSVKYEDAGSKVERARRAAARDDGEADGFYAMAPGPDGVLTRQFFPSRPPPPGSEHAARAPARDDAGGVYAMAPGPDGKLTYQYFPTKPPR